MRDTRDQSTILRADGTPIEWLSVDGGTGQLTVQPDTLAALRFLMGVEDNNPDALVKVAQETPALPLLAGLAQLACTLGHGLLGEKFRQALELWALNQELDAQNAAADVDAAGTAGAYQARRSPA